MNKLLKEAQILLRTAFQFDLPPPLHRRIENFLARNKPKRKATPKSKGGRLRREEKTKLRREYMASLRTDVFHRAEETCELCLMAAPTELHHLEGGSGRRAIQEVQNCMAVCMVCHRAFHRRSEDFRSVVEAWAEHHDYPIPRRFRGEPKPITPHITHAQLKRSAP